MREEIACYRIIRRYINGDRRTIKTGLTLAEARAHCTDPKTRVNGKYFDGYDLMEGVSVKRS